MADLESIPSTGSSSSTVSFEVIDRIEVPNPNVKPEIKPKPKFSPMQPKTDIMTETEAEVPEPLDEVPTDAEIAEVVEAFADLEALSEVKDTASEVNQVKDAVSEVKEAIVEAKDAPSEVNQVKDAVPEVKETTVVVIKTAPQPQLKSAENISYVQGYNKAPFKESSELSGNLADTKDQSICGAECLELDKSICCRHCEPPCPTAEIRLPHYRPLYDGQGNIEHYRPDDASVLAKFHKLGCECPACTVIEEYVRKLEHPLRLECLEPPLCANCKRVAYHTKYLVEADEIRLPASFNTASPPVAGGISLPSAQHLMIPFGDGWHNPNDENHVLSCLVCEETYRKGKNKEIKVDFGGNDHASSIATEGSDAPLSSKLSKTCCLDCEFYIDENHTICCPGYESGCPGKVLYKFADYMPQQSKEKVLCKYSHGKSHWDSVSSDNDRETETDLGSSIASDESESDCMACKALRLIGEDPSEHQLCPHHGKCSRPGHRPKCCEICVIFHEYASELKERYKDKECDCEGCRILVLLGMDPEEHELCRYRFEEVSEHEAPMCCGVCADLWAFAGKLEARISGEYSESELSSDSGSYSSVDDELEISNIHHPTHRVPHPAHNNPTHHAPRAPLAGHAPIHTHHHAPHTGNERPASHSNAHPAHHTHQIEHPDTHPTHHIPHAAHTHLSERQNAHPPHHALQNPHPHPAGHPDTHPANHVSHITHPQPAGLTNPYPLTHPAHGVCPPHPPHALYGPYPHPYTPHPAPYGYPTYPPPPPVQVNVGVPMPFYVPGHPGFQHQQLNPHPHPNPGHVHPQHHDQHKSHPGHVSSQHQEHHQSHHGQVSHRHQHQEHHDHLQHHEKKHHRAASPEFSEDDEESSYGSEEEEEEEDCNSDEEMSESSLPTIVAFAEEETRKGKEFQGKGKAKEDIDVVQYQHFNNAVVEDLKERTKYSSYNTHDPDYYVRCFNAFYNALLSPKVLSPEGLKRIITKNGNKAIRNFITLTSRQVYTNLGNSEIDEAISFIVGCEELVQYVRERHLSRLESEHNPHAAIGMKYNYKDLILSENIFRVLVEMHRGVEIGALLQQWVEEKEKEHITRVYPGVVCTPISGSPIRSDSDAGEGHSEPYRGRKGYYKHHCKRHRSPSPSVAESNDFSLPRSRSTTLPQRVEGSPHYHLGAIPPRTKIHSPCYSERSKSLSSLRSRSPLHRRHKIPVPHNYKFSFSPRSSSYSPTRRHHSLSPLRLPRLAPPFTSRYQSRLSKSYVHVMLLHRSSERQTWHTYDPECAGCKAVDEISSLEKKHGVKFAYAIIKERLEKEYAQRAGIWDQRESCELIMGNVDDLRDHAGALPQKLKFRLSSTRDDKERRQIWEEHNRIMAQYDAAFIRRDFNEVKRIELEKRAKVFVPYLTDVELRDKTGCQEINHHKCRHDDEEERESSLAETSNDSLADAYPHRSTSLPANSDRSHSIRQHIPEPWRPSDIFSSQFQPRGLQPALTQQERDGMDYFVKSARCSQALKNTEKKHQDLAKHVWSSSCLGCEQLSWLADLELDNHSPDEMRERVREGMFDLDNDIFTHMNRQPYDGEEAHEERIREVAWIQNLRDMLRDYFWASFIEAEKSPQFDSTGQSSFPRFPFTGSSSLGSTHHAGNHPIGAHSISPRDRPTGAFPRGRFSGFPSDKIPHSKPGDEYRRKMGIPTHPLPRFYSPMREASPLMPTNSALPHHDRHTSFHSSTIPRSAAGDETHHLLRQNLEHGTHHAHPTHHKHNKHHAHHAHHTHPHHIPQSHSPIPVSFRARGARIHIPHSEARGAHWSREHEYYVGGRSGL